MKLKTVQRTIFFVPKMTLFVVVVVLKTVQRITLFVVVVVVLMSNKSSTFFIEVVVVLDSNVTPTTTSRKGDFFYN